MMKTCPCCNSKPGTQKIEINGGEKSFWLLVGEQDCAICGKFIDGYFSKEYLEQEWNKYVDLINAFKAHLQPDRKTIYDCIREMSLKEMAQFIIDHFGVHYVVIDHKTRLDAAAVEEWLETEVIPNERL